MQFSIKDLGEIITGNTPSKTKEEYWNSADICFVKPDMISVDGITLIDDSNEYISEKARAKARVVPKDSIFVTCIGTIGKIGITSEGQYAFNQQINVIIPNDIVLPKYLAYSLLYSKSRLVEIANAPVVPIINKSQFGDFLVNIEVDKRKQEEMIEKLDKLSGIIERRKSELKELDNLIKARFVEMFGDPVFNSYGLKTKPMTEVCEIIDGDRGKNYPTADDFLEKGYCLFLNAKNVTSKGFNFDTCLFVSKEKDEMLRKGKLSIGDVVLTTRGTIGNLAYYTNDIPFEQIRINSGMVILRMKKEVIDEVYFIEHFKIQLADIKSKIASGSAQPQLPISTMNKIQILIPSIEKQKLYTEFVAQVNKSKVAVQKALDETQTLFDSLMQEYFG